MRPLFCAFFFLLSALPALGDRHAFILGNSDYRALDDLQNTLSDARAYQDTFARLGYRVSYHQNLSREDMADALETFEAGISPGDDVVFIFSGHGWSNGSQNYLIPVDAPLEGSQRKLQRRSFALQNGHDGVLDNLARSGAGQVVAIIDACRNNPFPPPPGRKSIGNKRGLVPIVANQGMFITFSAGAGQEALDRLSTDGPDQTLSVFSRNFIPELEKGVKLEDAIETASLATMKMARSEGGHAQVPAYYDQVPGPTCLSDTCALGGTRVVTPQLDCTALYQEAKEANACFAYDAFLEVCGDHPFAGLASKYLSYRCGQTTGSDDRQDGLGETVLAENDQETVSQDVSVVPAAPPKSANPAPARPRQFGLVVGIDDYNAYRPAGQTTSGLTDLQGAVNDASVIASAMIQAGINLQASHILMDEGATLGNFTHRWGQLVEDSRDGDTIIVTFAGHGYKRRESGEPYDEPGDGQDETILFADADGKGGKELTDDQLAQLFSQARGRNLIVVFDTVYAGGLLDDLSPATRSLTVNKLAPDALDHVTYILATEGENDLVMETTFDGANHAALSYFFAQALAGGAVRVDDGVLTPEALADYLDQKVTEHMDGKQKLRIRIAPKPVRGGALHLTGTR